MRVSPKFRSRGKSLGKIAINADKGLNSWINGMHGETVTLGVTTETSALCCDVNIIRGHAALEL
jgi:hypothetical protein